MMRNKQKQLVFFVDCVHDNKKQFIHFAADVSKKQTSMLTFGNQSYILYPSLRLTDDKQT